MDKHIEKLFELIEEIVDDTSVPSYREKVELIRKMAKESERDEGNLDEFLGWFNGSLEDEI